MRIVNFSVKDDEIEYFKKYSEKMNLECVIVKEGLTKKTSYLLDGADAVTDSMSTAYDELVYQDMKRAGISNLSLRSAGFDRLNKDLGQQYGMRFARVPSYSPNAISEHAVALTLVLLRKLHIGYLRFHNQDYRVDGLIGREIRDYKVGILGTGHIGLKAAKAFQGFGGQVFAYDLFPKDENRQWLNYIDDFDQFLSTVNLLVICLPLTGTTKHIVNKTSIDKLPKDSIIINVARGGHVDTEALYQALKSGHLAGASLDVYENEGMIYHQDLSCEVIDDDLFRKLESLPNVFITPHIAYNTHRAVENMVKISLENVVKMSTEERIENEIL